MCKLLYDEPPLTVLPSLAVVVGLEEAIVLQQIHYWVRRKQESGQDYKKGRYWVYNSYGEWQKQFPFWSETTVRRIIKRLKDSGLLLADNFNKAKFDNTKWYTIDYDKLEQRIAEHEKGAGENAAG